MMRIIGPIFLIVFVGATVYLVKDDALKFFNTLAHQKSEQVETVPNEVKEENFTIESEVEQSNIDREVVTPGPLTINITEDADTANLTVQRIIAETNTARKTNGVTDALKQNSKLEFSAQIKLKDMFNNNYFEHVSPNGTSVSMLGDKVHYEYIIIGENLALGNFKTEKELVDAWMASPGHRANILNQKYKDIGIAVGYGKILGQNTWLAVQHFGLSTDFCPQVNTSLKTDIETLEQELREEAASLEAQKQDIDSSKMYERGYKEKIDTYNESIKLYNTHIYTIKEKIALYNGQVSAFNACVEI